MIKIISQASLWAVLIASSLLPQSARAIQGGDGTAYFNHIPSLNDSFVNSKFTNIQGATLEFTVEVPAKTDLALQSLTIEQEKNINPLSVAADGISVLTGNRWTQDKVVPTKITMLNNGKGEMQILFDPPVAPGSTITVRVDPSLTPTTPGKYLYGITARAVGQKPFNYFLGYGTLKFASQTNDHTR